MRLRGDETVSSARHLGTVRATREMNKQELSLLLEILASLAVEVRRLPFLSSGLTPYPPVRGHQCPPRQPQARSNLQSIQPQEELLVVRPRWASTGDFWEMRHGVRSAVVGENGGSVNNRVIGSLSPRHFLCKTRTEMYLPQDLGGDSVS